MVDGTSYSDGNDDDEHFTNAASTGPHSVVVSASDCGSEGLGFKFHQSCNISALAGSHPELGVLWVQ